MAGLFEKDIRLLIRRKQTLVLFLALAVLLGFTQDGTFIMGYLPFLGTILTISTISYDEIDNGYTFLMTLPVDAKTYVKEKYLLCLSGAFITWVIAALIYFASNFVRDKNIDIINEIPIVAPFLPIVVLFMAIMIPFQLKFGAEKSKIVLFILFGIIAVVIFLFVQVIGTEAIGNIVTKIDQFDVTQIVPIVILLLILATVVSYVISCNIMQNKEL